jgi:serine/threonine protein kinase
VLVLDEAMTDLHHLVKAQQSRGHRLPLKIVRQWSHEILTGLAHLHSHHIMHRDLASTNVLIYKGDTVKICDFGLATEAHPSEMCKVHREIVTLWYRAPELLMGAEEYSSKIDVWSVGVVMLEMLLGRCPTVGRVQDVCTCPIATHFNYNGDQLMKIFGLLGSPTDKDRDFLQSMHCLEHFQDFPKHSSQLSQVVTTALLESLRDQISPQQLCRRTSSYLTDTPASKAQPCCPKARLLSVRSSILPRLKSSPIVSERLDSLGMTSLPRLKSASSPIMSESLGIPKIGLNNPHKHAGVDA